MINSDMHVPDFDEIGEFQTVFCCDRVLTYFTFWSLILKLIVVIHFKHVHVKLVEMILMLH